MRWSDRFLPTQTIPRFHDLEGPFQPKPSHVSMTLKVPSKPHHPMVCSLCVRVPLRAQCALVCKQ